MRKPKRALYALLITALAAGGVAVGTTAAQAHTAALSGVATCATDGSNTYSVNWTLNITSVPDRVTTTPTITTHAPAASTIANGTLAPHVSKGSSEVWTENFTQSGIPVSTAASVSVLSTWNDPQAPITSSKTVASPVTCAGPQPPAVKTVTPPLTPTCANPHVRWVEVTTITPYKLDSTGKWVLDTRHATSTRVNKTDSLTDAELDACAGPQPADKVDKTSTGPLTPTCAVPTVNWTDTTTTIHYVLDNHKWVADAPVVTTTPQSATLTSAELDACAGPQPDSKVVVTSTGPLTPTCAAPTVSWTETTTTTPYVLVDHKWVAGTAVVTTAEKSATLTDAEKTACVTTTPPPSSPPTTTTTTPPAAVPPVTTTPPSGVKGVGGTATPKPTKTKTATSTPSVKAAGGSSNSGSGSSGAGSGSTSVDSSSDTLAYTGTDTAELGALGASGLLLLLTGGAFIFTTSKRRKAASNR